MRNPVAVARRPNAQRSQAALAMVTTASDTGAHIGAPLRRAGGTRHATVGANPVFAHLTGLGVPVIFIYG